MIINYRLALSIIFCSLAFNVSAHAGQLDFDPEYRLYTSDYKKYKATDIESAIESISGDSASVTLFIHGRGNEPKKSLKGATLVEGRAVQKLEAQYKRPVVMFNWASSVPKLLPASRKRPLRNMARAADALYEVFNALKRYQSSGGKRVPVTLVAHSMGSIVIQTMIERHGWIGADSPIFQTVLFSAPDADDMGHTVWMDQIASVEKVFVVMNQNDKALRRSKSQRSKRARALGISTDTELSRFASYVNVTGLGEKIGEPIETHEIFNKEAMEKQVEICRFIDAVITGESLESFDLEKGNILQLDFRRGRNHDCFN